MRKFWPSALRLWLTGFCVLILQTLEADAQRSSFPNKPITMVVPTSAGGAVDVLARLVAVRVAEELGQSVVVENRSGAGGNIGTASVARAASDGHTLLFISGTQLVNQLTSNPPPYDLFKDYVPVALVVESSQVIGISAKLQATTLEEFAKAARAERSLFNYATPGIGTGPHLGAEMLSRALDIKMVHVPFRGSMEGMRELASGNVQLSIGALPSFTPLIEHVRIVAVAGPKRLSSLPNIPTTFELGYPTVEIAFWAGILAPKGTPQDIVQALNRSVNKALRHGELVSVFSKQGIEPSQGDPQHFSTRMEYYASSYRPIVSTIDLTPK
jgi:tripartite-type tricarboxylate transporter receptor subunit TctC